MTCQVPLSAPTAGEEEEGGEGAIHLAEKGHVNLLFGALGDGRYLFATLR